MSSFRISQRALTYAPLITSSNIPAWQSDGSNNIFYYGNVGINNITPQNAVDICGSINITARTTDASGNLYGITPYYNVRGTAVNNTFYPGLSESTALNSISTWTLRSHTSNKEFRSVCWSPERSIFVAVSSLGTGDRVVTSPDGITWTTRTTPADYIWRSVCWSPELNLFVAVGYQSTGIVNTCMTSSNGIDWTLRTTPADYQWICVIWARELGLFVAVAQSGTGNRCMTSSNGVDWTLRTTPADYDWRYVCWSPELRLLVAVSLTGTGNRCMTSSDGINWTLRNTPADINYESVCWSPELAIFVAVAGTGASGRVITSPDGINWTLRTSILSYWNSVIWSPQLRVFVAVAQSGTRLMYSFDGINWLGQTIDTTPSYNNVCWSPELSIFVAVGERDSSATTLIATSSLSGRIPTSYNFFDSSFNNINEFNLWNFQSFSRGVPVLKTGSSTITINPGENWVDCSMSADVSCNLPSASLYPGLEITLKNTATSRVDATVLSRTTNQPTGTLLTNVRGNWVTIVSNGTNWVVENGT